MKSIKSEILKQEIIRSKADSFSEREMVSTLDDIEMIDSQIEELSNQLKQLKKQRMKSQVEITESLEALKLHNEVNEILKRVNSMESLL